MAQAPKIAVVYYSATGTVYRMARELEAGAREAGAEVRLRRVAELAPPEAIAQNPAWKAHVEATSGVTLASLDDLEWADAYLFGTPTRYGNVASQLKQFMDSTGPLWAQGKLANKVAAGFTSASNPHGGQESTLLALYNVLYHWGCIVVSPGYTDPRVFAAGGNPYGASWTANRGQPPLSDAARAALRHLAERVTQVTRWVMAGRRAEAHVDVN
ncbi:NAD(P)H:quinone oxidoreductase [Carboxydochorda subterranea]|uniref:NAD(P)H:quinone oxidoreductase n=1 Tax=Carboxydichorda subterranea TaxID=3109565 RepID=A0ABZ1BUF5_9FIRM|nr:NAD(P)H:quinone oxidoreductase [Limnochorda sp. L945t]WRP16283.1 NAD(P)H:quinone oxidoreductase [Limnochorda sp. L945t]